jgi:hypothetical protein
VARRPVAHRAGVRVLDDEDPYLIVAAGSRAPRRSRTSRTRSRSSAASGSATRSRPAGRRATTTRSSASPRRVECVRTHLSASSTSTWTRRRSASSASGHGRDVFGNGLLRSPHVRLVAAFNHKDVFLDPDPDPARSFAERSACFAAGRSWDSYDPAVLSPGGLVARRAAKKVVLRRGARAARRDRGRAQRRGGRPGNPASRRRSALERRHRHLRARASTSPTRSSAIPRTTASASPRTSYAREGIGEGSTSA